MPTTTAPSLVGRSTYLELVAEFQPRRITTRQGLAAAAAQVDAITDRAPLSEDEKAYLFVLGLVIKEYEDREFPPAPLSDADLLRDLLEERDMTQAQLAAEAKIAESTVSAILKGHRKISRAHIPALIRTFGVSPVVFFRD